MHILFFFNYFSMAVFSVRREIGRVLAVFERIMAIYIYWAL
jgi:hypothetical protein